MKKSPLLYILLLSVLLRVAAAVYMGNEVVPLPGTSDQVSYHALALRILDGHGFSFGEAWWPITDANAPTAHWSFIYTGYLVVVYRIFGVLPLLARLIQAVIVGLLQPYLAYRLTRQVFNMAPAERLFTHLSPFMVETVPLLAAGISAIYFYFVYYAAALMTEPFYIITLLASLTLAISLAERLPERGYLFQAVGLGIMLAVTVLLRQLFLLVIPFIFLWVLLVTWKQGVWKQVFVSFSLIAGILLLAILPITAYNYSRFNRFVLLNTNAGYAFFWGNHPVYGTKFIPASEMGERYQKLIPDELHHLDEAALDNALLKEGLQFIVDEPDRYWQLSLSRIPAYFKFWPDAASGTLSNIARVGSFGLFLPFMLLGLIRSWLPVRHPRDKAAFAYLSAANLFLMLFMLVYTAIHVLTWAQVRYRLPVDAVLVIYAALTFGSIMEFISKRRWGKGEQTALPQTVTVE